MVAVHPKVAFSLDRQRNPTVAGKKGQHMVKESDTGLDSYRLLLVQIHSQLNISLLCFSLDFSLSHGNSFYFSCLRASMALACPCRPSA